MWLVYQLWDRIRDHFWFYCKWYRFYDSIKSQFWYWQIHLGQYFLEVFYFFMFIWGVSASWGANTSDRSVRMRCLFIYFVTILRLNFWLLVKVAFMLHATMNNMLFYCGIIFLITIAFLGFLNMCRSFFIFWSSCWNFFNRLVM